MTDATSPATNPAGGSVVITNYPQPPHPSLPRQPFPVSAAGLSQNPTLLLAPTPASILDYPNIFDTDWFPDLSPSQPSNWSPGATSTGLTAMGPQVLSRPISQIREDPMPRSSAMKMPVERLIEECKTLNCAAPGAHAEEEDDDDACGDDCVDACDKCCDPQTCTTMICEDKNCGVGTCEVVVECTGDDECDNACGGPACVNDACQSPPGGGEDGHDQWPDFRNHHQAQYNHGNVPVSSHAGTQMQDTYFGRGFEGISYVGPANHHGHGLSDLTAHALTLASSDKRHRPPTGGFTELSYFAPTGLAKRHSASSSVPRFLYPDYPSPSKRRRMSSMTTSTSLGASDPYFTPPSSVSPTSRATSVNSDALLSCQWDISCDETFFNGDALWHHIQTTHNPLDSVCHWNNCGTSNSDSQGLYNHLSHNHVPPMGQEQLCPQHCCLWKECNESFSSEDDLRRHINNVHLQENTHQCLWEACGVEAPTDGEISEHIQEHVHHEHAHHHEHPHPVPETQTQMSYTSSIPKRLSISTQQSQPSPQKFPPTISIPPIPNTRPPTPSLSLPTPLSSPTKSTPSSDPSTPSGPKVCKWQDEINGTIHTCNQEFPSAEALQVHAKLVHISELKKRTGYFCRWEGCSRKTGAFSQKGKVERHLQTHTGYKSCTCNYCGKEFSAPQALQQHIRTHTGEKPYKCDICHKEFAQGSAMTMHRRVHTGERPLKCDFPGCGKAFSESSNLSKHRKTHNPDQMKRHLKTHEGAAPPLQPASNSVVANTAVGVGS
ncbi:hypothetical protein EX30DRAFT_396786 [Ascodesmis nigricans]|uniref:C2H2-type domain-containing protein n=1 Tax=Ascodesmis nigricans TaxID=341454 RepID=A0A4S2MT95_9PEZI|nr:hypothetical protein EX30DRAFT_396786 [Ascodesmis nigricans]